MAEHVTLKKEVFTLAGFGVREGADFPSVFRAKPKALSSMAQLFLEHRNHGRAS
jgi:hypothetical protein